MSFSEGFQEAFRRFEKRVDTSKFKNFTELGRAFAHWASYRWVGTYRQHSALAYEARERGFEDAYIPYSVHARARPSQERWSGAYKKRVRKARKVVMRKYKGVGKVRIKAINPHFFSAVMMSSYFYKDGLNCDSRIPTLSQRFWIVK